MLGAHLSRGGVAACASPCGRPTPSVVSVIGDFNSGIATRHPMRPRRRHLGDLHSRPRRRATHYKYSVLAHDGDAAGQMRPLRASSRRFRRRTASVVWPLTNYVWGDAAVDGERARTATCCASPCRSTKSIWDRGCAAAQRMAHLSRAGRQAGPSTLAHGLHAPGTAARHGASVLRLLGLPGDRLLRAHLALRHARRLPLFRRSLPSGRARRDSRLGARRISRATPTACGASTAPRSTSTPIRARASIANGARLIFNYGRNEVPRLPALERHVLAQGVSHRRPARGRRGFHAVSRLLAQARRMDSESLRRPRESGSHRVHPAL